MNFLNSTSFVGALYVLGAITAWGSYFPFAKLILERLSPEVFLVFRLGIGTVILLLLSRRLRKSFAVRRRDLLILVGAGCIGIIAHQMIQLTGLRYTTATNTGWILTLIPPVTGVLGWLFLRERVTARQVVGLGIAILGVVLFVSRGDPTQLSFIQHYGDLLALLSVGTWSVYTVVTKSRLSRYDPLPVSAMHMGLGFLFFLLLAGRHIPAQVGGLEPLHWLVIVLIGVIPSGLAYYWWNAGLQRLSAVNTSMFLFIEAIVASLAGALLLGEAFTPSMALYAAIIVAGVTITQTARRQRAISTGEAAG